jgi:hypothetical protein
MYGKCELCGKPRTEPEDCYTLAIPKPFKFDPLRTEPLITEKSFIRKAVCKSCVEQKG